MATGEIKSNTISTVKGSYSSNTGESTFTLSRTFQRSYLLIGKNRACILYTGSDGSGCSVLSLTDATHTVSYSGSNGFLVDGFEWYDTPYAIGISY